MAAGTWLAGVLYDYFGVYAPAFAAGVGFNLLNLVVVGALPTLLISSLLQGLAMTGFVVTQDEAGLYGVAAAFGIGFSALIPAYVLTIRDLYPMSEAHWRVPTLLLFSGSGMATGGWLAGYLYDIYGYYTPAFATGVAFNVANIAILFMLLMRQRMTTAATAR